MRPAMKAIAAAIAAGCVLAGCSTFLDLLEGRPVAAATPGVNLLRNPGFENFKGNAETPFVHDGGKTSARGVAADWVVCPGSQVITTSISKEAAEGGFSQRVDVQAVRPDRQTPHVAFTQSQARLRLKGNTQYELAAWVKGRGVASLSVMLNDDESRALGSKVVLTDTWQHVQMVFVTPKRVRNMRELIRFGEDGDSAGAGGVAEGDWILIDGFSLRASVPRLSSLTPEAISSIAERRAVGVTPGAKVIAAALTLVRSGTVVKGGCWDWVNRAFNDAGYTANKRRAVFQSKPEGPFVNIALIEPGDWISFRNLTYGEIGHSALFVDWIDFDRHSAITLEYAGENREIPGRYREFDIFKCYLVTRPVD
jgi:hypothetical protein